MNNEELEMVTKLQDAGILPLDITKAKVDYMVKTVRKAILKELGTLDKKSVKGILEGVFGGRYQIERKTSGDILCATNLISNLIPQQVPTEDNIKGIIIDAMEDLNEYFHESGREQLDEEQIEKFATKLLSKLNIPQQGKVICEGIVGNEMVTKIINETVKYYGKKIQIILKECE